MKGQWFGKVQYIGVSKGYQRLSQILQVLKSFGKNGNECTAYELAHLIDLSPQHVNRLLRKMYEEGKVECEVVKRHGREARVWWEK